MLIWLLLLKKKIKIKAYFAFQSQEKKNRETNHILTPPSFTGCSAETPYFPTNQHSVHND